MLGLMVSLLACGDYKHREPRTPTAPEWMVQQVDAQAKQVAPDAAPVTPLYRNIAYKRNDNGKWPLELQQGSCYLVSTVGDETVERFYVLLWDTKGDRKIETKQPAPGLVAEYCATESGTHELEVKIAGGHGHFLTQVFAKGGAAPTAAAGTDEPAPPPPPAANPATPEPAADPIASRIASLAMAAAGAERVGEMREGAADVTRLPFRVCPGAALALAVAAAVARRAPAWRFDDGDAAAARGAAPASRGPHRALVAVEATTLARMSVSPIWAAA